MYGWLSMKRLDSLNVALARDKGISPSFIKYVLVSLISNFLSKLKLPNISSLDKRFLPKNVKEVRMPYCLVSFSYLSLPSCFIDLYNSGKCVESPTSFIVTYSFAGRKLQIIVSEYLNESNWIKVIVILPTYIKPNDMITVSNIAVLLELNDWKNALAYISQIL